MHNRSTEYKDAIKALRKEILMSRAKEEMFSDFNIGRSGYVPNAVREYLEFFNKARHSFTLCYLTPFQYKDWKPKLPAIVGKSNGK